MSEKSGLWILLADDEEVIHRAVGDYLRSIGHRVEEASSGTEALNKIEGCNFDLALVDVRMPGTDGLSLVKRIRELRPDLPLITITGFGNKEMVIEALRLGVADFLPKPIKLTDLDTALERVMRRRERNRDHVLLFEDSPLPLRWEDWSEVENRLLEIGSQGISDFRDYFQSHPETVRDLGGLVRILDVNQAALELHGAATKAELLESLKVLYAVQPPRVFREALLAFLKGDRQIQAEIIHRTMEGKKITISQHFGLARDNGHSLEQVLITMLDISERKRSEQEISLLTHAMMNISDNVYISDMSNQIIYVNDAFCRTYGYEREEILGEKSEVLWKVTDGVGAREGMFRRTFKNGWENEFMDVGKDGGEIPVSLSASVLRNEAGVSVAIVRVSRDISARKRLEKALQHLALLDTLTSLPNRLSFKKSFDLEWRRARRTKQPLSMIMIDVDLFKRYNDSLGHPAGDECLKQVAYTIKRSLRRATDLVARYGGEEFVVLLPGTDEEVAATLAEKLRGAIQALGMGHPDSDVDECVTISLGVSTVWAHQDIEPKMLVQQSDQALYRAKREGRNRARVHEEEEPPPGGGGTGGPSGRDQ